MAAALQLMRVTRNPAEDPQPGDEFRVPGGFPRKIVAREPNRVRVEYGDRRIWLRLDVWRRKCAVKEIVPMGQRS